MLWPLEININDFIDLKEFILNDDFENIDFMLPNVEGIPKNKSNQDDKDICKKRPRGRPKRTLPLSQSLKRERRKAANGREKRRMHRLSKYMRFWGFVQFA